VTQNERFAQFISEKRPFFLEGIELFSTPNQLVYTRRIADPIAGGKLTGKFGRYSIAHLTALDQLPGDDAIANVTRVRRDLRRNSVLGVTLTDRELGGEYNRVASADARILFKRLYYVEAQLAGGWTRDASGARSDALWRIEADRTGRTYGFNYSLNGIGDDFSSALGFVPRRGIVDAGIRNRLRWYGDRGALIEAVTGFFSQEYKWRYDDFGRGSRLEGEEGLSLDAALRGGWSVDANIDREFYRLDPADYAGMTVTGAGGPTPFVPPDEISGLFGYSLEIGSPIWPWASADVEFRRSAVAIFDEAAEGIETDAEFDLSLRPTHDIRLSASTVYSRPSPRATTTGLPARSFPRGAADYK